MVALQQLLKKTRLQELHNMGRRNNQIGTAMRWGLAVSTDTDRLQEGEGRGQKGFGSDGEEKKYPMDQGRLCNFCCMLENL